MRLPRRFYLFAAFLALTISALTVTGNAQQNVISTYMGGGPNNIPAIDSDIDQPSFVVLDNAGNYYVSGVYSSRVFKVNSSGTLTVLAGTGLDGYSGDGGPATAATLSTPSGLAVDSSGNVYIADTNNQVIRMVNSSGIISTIAGTLYSCQYDGDTTGTGGDGKPATEHSLCDPGFLTLDGSGNLYIADSGNDRIRKLVISNDSISTVAGNGSTTACKNGTAATSCGFSNPSGVAVDTAGDLFISDTNDQVIREVAVSGKNANKVETVAGTLSTAGFSGDGSKATSAEFNAPYGIAVDAAGANVWVADTENVRIRKFAVGGTINTIAGDGDFSYCGDGGPATAACLNYPVSVTIDSAGNLYIADQNNYVVRQVNTSQIINTIAGNGTLTQTTLVSGTSTGITLNYPWGLIGDPSGDLFVANQYTFAVQEFVASSDLVNVFAGTGIEGYNGDNIPANTAELNYPAGVARDSAGNIYIADLDNCLIRKVNSAGTISTFAGTVGGCGYSGDGGPATSAFLSPPQGVAVDASGNLYIADTYNAVVRKVSGGTITTVAGTPLNQGFGGDGGLATSALLAYPGDVRVDAAGNVYIADTNNQRIRKVTAATGDISTVAGNGNVGFSGDGVATENSIYFPSGIWLDANANLFISDQYNSRIRMVDGGGTMTTVAGNGASGWTGDGGLAIDASIYGPFGIYVDGTGNLFISDSFNLRVREVNAFAAVGRSTGSLTFGAFQVGVTASAQTVTLSGVGPATISSIVASGDFSETNNCSNLPNGTTCTVNVLFTPTASGLRTGTLTINSNGFLSTISTVALQGQGAALSVAGTLAFGSVKLNTSLTKSVTLTNGGTTAVTINSITLSETADYAFGNATTCPTAGGTLAANATCTIAVTFTPHTTGLKSGTLTVNSNDPASPLLLAYSGTGTSTGGALESFTPASIAFPTTALNVATKSIKAAFKYTGTATLTLTSLVPTANFTLNVTGLTSPCSLTGTTVLTAGQVCNFNVVFTPTAINTVSGTVTANFTGDPKSKSLALPVSGVGTEVVFTPATLSFGSVAHGSTKSLKLTVKNVSTANVLHVTATSFTGTDAAEYSVTSNTCSAVNPGKTCAFTVQFAPVAAGTSQAATLNVTDDGGGSPQLVAVTGNGT